VVGVYETYDGEIVTIVDAKSRTCADLTHKSGQPIPESIIEPSRRD